MQTGTVTRTAIHARHIASKVAADLKRLQRIYQIGSPSDSDIDRYQKEIAMLLEEGYLGTVTYGFKRAGKWVVALRYQSIDGTLHSGGDDRGGMKPEVDMSVTGFTSVLSYSQLWFSLSQTEKEALKNSLPVPRGTGNEPAIENGYWVEGRKYRSGELGVQRSLIQRL